MANNIIKLVKNSSIKHKEILKFLEEILTSKKNDVKGVIVAVLHTDMEVSYDCHGLEDHEILGLLDIVKYDVISESGCDEDEE